MWHSKIRTCQQKQAEASQIMPATTTHAVPTEVLSGVVSCLNRVGDIASFARVCKAYLQAARSSAPRELVLNLSDLELLFLQHLLKAGLRGGLTSVRLLGPKETEYASSGLEEYTIWGVLGCFPLRRLAFCGKTSLISTVDAQALQSLTVHGTWGPVDLSRLVALEELVISTVPHLDAGFKLTLPPSIRSLCVDACRIENPGSLQALQNLDVDTTITTEELARLLAACPALRYLRVRQLRLATNTVARRVRLPRLQALIVERGEPGIALDTTDVESYSVSGCAVVRCVYTLFAAARWSPAYGGG